MMDRELQVTHGFGRQGISGSNGYNGSGVLFGPSNRLVPCTFLLSMLAFDPGFSNIPAC